MEDNKFTGAYALSREVSSLTSELKELKEENEQAKELLKTAADFLTNTNVINAINRFLDKKP